MSKANSPGGSRPAADTAAERKPRGNAFKGSDQKDAPEQAGNEKSGRGKARNPDAELHFGKDRTLYEDGLETKEDSDLLYGAHGTSWGIKP